MQQNGHPDKRYASTMTNFSHVPENIERLQAEIRSAAERAGRDPSEVRLVAVTKTYPAEAVTAAARAGITNTGENRVQEAIPKMEELTKDTAAAELHWHLIGRLQTNKAKLAVQNFDLIHSVDSERLAREIHKHAATADKIMPVLLQVNISGEQSKSGFNPSDLHSALQRILKDCPAVRIDGFMTMAPLDDPEKARPVFRDLKKLRDRLATEIQHERFNPRELSMGMSNDFAVAIEEGATLIRIGTAIFGQRDYSK